MSKQDVLDWLIERSLESDNWYRVKDIKEGLISKGVSNGVANKVYNDLLILTACGDVLMRNVGLWDSHKEFKAK